MLIYYVKPIIAQESAKSNISFFYDFGGNNFVPVSSAPMIIVKLFFLFFLWKIILIVFFAFCTFFVVFSM